MNETLITVNDLKVHFPIKRGIFSRTVGYVYAVDGVSFELAKGETLGIVGESGCGKSTMLMMIAVVLGVAAPAGEVHHRVGNGVRGGTLGNRHGQPHERATRLSPQRPEAHTGRNSHGRSAAASARGWMAAQPMRSPGMESSLE